MSSEEDSDDDCHTAAGSSAWGGAGASASGGRKRGSGAWGRLEQQVGQAALLRKIQGLLHLPAPQAASLLGCSATKFRQLCRSVGIARWPSHRPSKGGARDGE